MLERLRDAQAVVLRPVARLLLRCGVGPDLVTWVGTISVIGAALVCFPLGWLWQGAVLVAICSCADMIDGHLARELGPASRWGSFLDASLDRFADAAVLGGLAWYLGLHHAPIWSVIAIIALVMAQATSYVKARAEAVGCSADVGLVTRADRIILALIGAGLAGVGVPLALEISMTILAVAGLITVVQRFWTVRRQLAPAGAPAGRRRSRV